VWKRTCPPPCAGRSGSVCAGPGPGGGCCRSPTRG
jgi:hypothetical protein